VLLASVAAAVLAGVSLFQVLAAAIPAGLLLEFAL
jgi:hypothetical protein